MHIVKQNGHVQTPDWLLCYSVVYPPDFCRNVPTLKPILRLYDLATKSPDFCQIVHKAVLVTLRYATLSLCYVGIL